MAAFYVRLFCIVSLTNLVLASVEFTSSTLYDIHDFIGKTEVSILRCENGCVIYASTQGEAFVQYPDKLDPYARKLLITDNNSGFNISIADLAKQAVKKAPKTQLIFNAHSKISVFNENVPSQVSWDIVLYVVDKIVADVVSNEVYDAYYMLNYDDINPTANYFTIMSAYALRIASPPSVERTTVKARLTGFDNIAYEQDACPDVYNSPQVDPFPGLILYADTPVISFFLSNPKAMFFDVNFNYMPGRIFSSFDGFIANSGWNGCTKPNNGGIQSFRRRNPLDTDLFYFYGDADTKYDVTLELYPHLDAKHPLFLDNDADPGNRKTITGVTHQTITLKSTEGFEIYYTGLSGDQGFLMKYSSNPVQPETIPSSTTTASSVSSTTSKSTTTTSSAAGISLGAAIFAALLTSFYQL